MIYTHKLTGRALVLRTLTDTGNGVFDEAGARVECPMDLVECNEAADMVYFLNKLPPERARDPDAVALMRSHL